MPVYKIWLTPQVEYGGNEFGRATMDLEPVMTIEIITEKNWPAGAFKSEGVLRFANSWLDLGTLGEFLDSAQEVWLELQEGPPYRGAGFSVWFEEVGSWEQSKIKDGYTYLLDGWDDFRIWLVKMVLRSFDTQGPISYEFRGVSYPSH